MADISFSELTEATTVDLGATTTIAPVSINVATTPASRKITFGTLRDWLSTAFTALTLTGGTLTASTPAITVTQTWNNAAVDFIGADYNITNTASGANSRLFRLRVGGTSRFAVGVFGNLFQAGGVATASMPMQTITQEWNSGGVTFVAADMDIADTASAAASILQRWRVNSTQVAAILKTGALQLGANSGSNAAVNIDTASFSDSGIRFNKSGTLMGTLDTSSTNTFLFQGRNGVALNFGANSLTKWVVPSEASGTSTLTSASATARYVGGSSNGNDWRNSGNTRTNANVADNGTSAFFAADGSTTGLTITSAGFAKLGGTTSSFPGLKRVSAGIQARLADDSAYAAFDALSYAVGGVAGASGGPFTAITSITVVNGIITNITGT